jgi:serine/threonine-protein kinase
MVGGTIGSYRITEKLGEGGMGVVYAAEHQVMGRRAVVKMLRTHLSGDKDIVKRFFNEARAAARIRHPGIVDVYDVGYHDDGAAYIVMDRLDGESLAQRVRRAGRLDTDTAVSLLRQVLGALGAAHAAGIVHRDLKPDNIFVVRDPELPSGERPKILDFGIAKLQGEGGGHGVTTQTGAMMGTPVYMSPEQCRGAGEVDHRTDLYAIGCILFELLTGRPPFLADAPGDLMVAHMRDEPPLARSFCATVPAALDDIIRALLAKDPDDRFASCEALIHALDNATGGKHATGKSLPPSTAQPAENVPSDPFAATAISDAPSTEPEPSTQPAKVTTLGGAASQVTEPAASRRSPVLAISLAAVAVVAAAAAVYVVTRDKGDDSGQAASVTDTGDGPAHLIPPPSDLVQPPPDAGLAMPTTTLPPIDIAPVDAERTAAGRRHNKRALSLHRRGDFAAAIEEYEQAVRADAGHVIARYNLSCAYNVAGRTDDGLALLKQFKDAGCPVCLGRLVRARADSEWQTARDDPRFIAVTRDVVVDQPSLYEMSADVARALQTGEHAAIAGYFHPRNGTAILVRRRDCAGKGCRYRDTRHSFPDVAAWLTEQTAGFAAGEPSCSGNCCKYEPIATESLALRKLCTSLDSGAIRVITRLELEGP